MPMREVVRIYGEKNPTPSSISNTELIDVVVPLNANGPLHFGPSLNLDHSSAEEADREHDVQARARGESAFLSINRGGRCNRKPIFIVVIFGTSEVGD